MTTRLAVLGFRHGHIMSVYNQAREAADVEVAAAAEDHAPTREQLADSVAFTHDSCERALDEVACDAVAIGDYYGRRGSLAIAALERGLHVIADKPLCTSLDELKEIERLATAKGLSVGCQLDLRHSGKYRALRRLVREEKVLGEIHAIGFGGQHPLMYGTRAGWYFEEGKHGGTINDIAIHGLDLIPWLTGLAFDRVNAARNWNAVLPQVPHFRDCAQFMLTMRNGCGVLGDVSYLAPDSHGYGLPQYWRFTIWGSQGVAEVDNAHPGVILYPGGESMREVPPDPNGEGAFRAFLAELRGESGDICPTTAEVIASACVTLQVQAAADRPATDVPLG